MENNKFGLDFTPSAFQEKIFDFILHGNGNCVISAKAGSGKTFTCVEAMKLIKPKNKVMFLAFNKSIAEELSNKLKEYKNVEVRTSHSLGFAMIKRNIDGEIELDEYKYRGYLKEHVLEFTSSLNKRMTKNEFVSYIDNITQLIDFARYNLAQSTEEVNQLAIKYDIPILGNECDIVIKMLNWGKTVLNRVDFTDMVWLPVECSMSARGFQKDFIFIDECQDQSLMSIQLFLKCFKRGTRFIACGDENQTINTFSGSSEEAFEYMRSYPKTKLFDLPICYRCPKKVIKLAQILVPKILSKEDAIDGDIIENCFTSTLRSGDMVICRSKAPLVNVYTKLLERNVPCYIKGQEFGLNLKKLLDEIDFEELNISLKEDGVFVRLYDRLFEARNKLMISSLMDYKDATLSSYIMNVYDMIKALEILGGKSVTKTELITRIDDLFNDEVGGVMLSTIHKAKGLEADNVYILCHSSMPSSLAKKKWEIESEKNLMYVAYTRAKKVLGFISEKEIKPFGVSQSDDAILKELGNIEALVCRILGKIPTEEQKSIDVARFNLNNGLTNIEKTHDFDNFLYITPKENEENDILKELDGLLS